ncbi:hypothetical protein SNE40_019187 [Patella caerulea]|uniref:Ankyrin repeat protein n=1 Tax=Patella caerulea TaxID=87958 RepID=A0AAN8J854_PATCE
MAATRLEEIKKIIAENPQLINAELQNPSILGKEAEAGNAECVDLLLKSGAEVDIIDSYNNTPIVYCLRSKDGVKEEEKLECLRLLINAGSQLYRLHDDRTPLMIAANLCEEDCLREILKVGYLNGPKTDLLLDSNQNNVNKEMNDDEEEEEDEDDFSDSDIDNEYDRYLFNDHPNYYARYMAKYCTTLDFRDRNGFTAVYHCLFDNETPAPVTTSKKIACLRILKEAGCSFSITHLDGTLIDTALRIDFDLEIIKLLMEFGCKINFYDCFLWAASNLDLPAVKFFIAKGGNLKEINQSGTTVLHEVLRKYNEDNHYADKQYTTTEEKYERTKTMMKFFIKEKVDLNAKIYNRLPAVVFACLYYLVGFNFPLEYLISENVTLEKSNFKFNHEMEDSDALYWCIKTCMDDAWSRANFTSTKKMKLLKLLHLCGMSRKGCLNFRNDEEPGSEIIKWLEELSSKPETLLSICTHKIRTFIGHDIKDKIASLEVPFIVKDLLLLKDILTSECFE